MSSINEEMRALDQKDRDFYDNLSEEERKKFSTYLMIRFGSSVDGRDVGSDLQEYYLIATNERMNKNFFDISAKEHNKLHWLTTTTISPGMGSFFHRWIPLKKKEAGKVGKFLRSIYPLAKESDLNLLEELNDLKSWKERAKDMGWDNDRIKKELG